MAAHVAGTKAAEAKAAEAKAAEAKAAEAKVAEAKAAKLITTPLVEGKREPKALTRERSALPILIYGGGENIKTNLVELTEQRTIIARVEFGDAFNCGAAGE